MKEYVTDTHALFWYLTDSKRLGKQARAVFDESKTGNAFIYIPAIVMAELYFLNRKATPPLDFPAEFQKLDDAGQFHFVPFEAEQVLDFEHDQSLEMHDRIIVGVARRFGIPCLTRDSQIISSGMVPTLW